MRAVRSLLKERDFRKNFIDVLRKSFILLGVLFTFYQVLEAFFDFEINLFWSLLIFLSALITSLIWEYFETRTLLSKTFYLEDGYKVTVDVNDYLDNAEHYLDAHLVSGSNNEFNIEYAEEGTLQRDLVDTYFLQDEDMESRAFVNNGNDREYDENNNERKYNYNELIESLSYKTENYEDYHLELLNDDNHGRRYFAYGSIISEKCNTMVMKETSFLKRVLKLNRKERKKHRNINKTRRILFFANSQYRGGEYKGNKDTLNSMHRIWEHFHTQKVHVNALLMPLLGTGLSNDATPMSSTTAIIDNFFKLSYPTCEKTKELSNIVPHLIISIHPDNVID